jgi:hypothetical protein
MGERRATLKTVVITSSGTGVKTSIQREIALGASDIYSTIYTC